MGKKSRANRNRPRVSRQVMNEATVQAMFEVAEVWNRMDDEGTISDGSDRDLERGPEDERLVAGERVRTWEDKVFGGRAVTVLRQDGDETLHYALGRVANSETRGSILASEIAAHAGAPLAPAPAVASGVWRNDRNGWVTEQVTGLTEEEAIEQLVPAFQRNVPRGPNELASLDV
jgi:hypothetical protein